MLPAASTTPQLSILPAGCRSFTAKQASEQSGVLCVVSVAAFFAATIVPAATFTTGLCLTLRRRANVLGSPGRCGRGGSLGCWRCGRLLPRSPKSGRRGHSDSRTQVGGTGDAFISQHSPHRTQQPGCSSRPQQTSHSSHTAPPDRTKTTLGKATHAESANGPRQHYRSAGGVKKLNGLMLVRYRTFTSVPLSFQCS